MTTLVRTRQPLQVLSMSNQPERRHSKRLAGTSLPLLPSRPLPLARLPEQENQPPPAAGTKGRKRKDVEADVLPAATAVYEEQDGDFLFTRGSKRVKTAPVPEEETDPEPTPAPAPAKRGVGRPPKTGARRKASPPAPGLAPAPQPPPTQPRLAAPAATRRTSKRKTSLDYAPAVPPPEEDAVVLKSKTRRKARETTAERRPQPKAGRLAAQANEGYQGMEEEDGYEEEEDEQRDPPRRKEATSRAAAVPGPSSQAQMIALPFSDTPIINRNKEFRKKGGAAGGRRSSLGMRGRRASSLIDNGQSALPHREVDPAEFYKYIAAEGLSEPRRMKQLLIWCGERALSEKPPHGSQGSSAVLGGEFLKEGWLGVKYAIADRECFVQPARYRTSCSRTLARGPSSRTGLRARTRPSRSCPSCFSPTRATSTTTPRSPSLRPRSKGISTPTPSPNTHPLSYGH